MSEPATATLSPAVNQLAYFWATQNDANRLIFNQLYGEAPELVLRVLTQGQLAPDPAHRSLDEIVAPAGSDAVFNQSRVDVSDVKLNPEFPSPNEPFELTWKRTFQGEIPNHNDSVQILKPDGTVVAERPVARGAGTHGATDEQTMLFDGLPAGEYTVYIWANLEGSDGTGVPTAQGMRGHGGAQLYVGNTANSQVQQQQPAAGGAVSGVVAAAYAAEQMMAVQPGQPANTWDSEFRLGLLNAAEALLGIESLGAGFQAELTRISRQLESAIEWGPELAEGGVNALVQRLHGMAQIDAAASPGDLAVAIIEVVGDLY